MGNGLCRYRASVAYVGAPIVDGVGVDDLAPDPRPGNTNAVAIPGDGGEVAYEGQGGSAPVEPQPAQEAAGPVVGVDPAEPLPAHVVHFPQRVTFPVEELEVLKALLNAGMERVLKAVPVKFPVMVPFACLSQLTAHEEKFFARVGYGGGKEESLLGRFSPVVAWHLSPQRALEMDHLVVGQGQEKPFAERVEQTEGHKIVIVASVERVQLHIGQRVVHPAHVPLEVETQSSLVDGACDAAPGGALFGYGHDSRAHCLNGPVHLLEEADRLQVLASAVFVGDPLSVAPGVVQVEHRGNRIDTESVDVVLPAPEDGVADEEVSYFIAVEVEDLGAPVRVFSLAGVLVFIETGPVVAGQSPGISREMGRHPVDDDADAGLVEGLDKFHEIAGCAVPRGGGEVARCLIAPGTVKRMFRDGQEFDVGEAHILHVGDKPVRKFHVGVETPVGVSHPAAQVTFIG